VVVATGWARFKYEVEQERAGQGGKSWCEDCEDEHGYTYVGTQSELLTQYSGFETVLAFSGGRGLGFARVGGAPCSCWGEKLDWVSYLALRKCPRGLLLGYFLTPVELCSEGGVMAIGSHPANS